MPGLGTTADFDPTISVDPLRERGKQGQLLGYHTMASQANRTAAPVVEMHNYLELLGMTWQEYVDAKIKPQIEWGLRGFCFHLPHGRTTRGTIERYMDFDAYLISRKKKLIQAKGFTKAIRPLVKDGIRVICYMGSLRETPRMADLRSKPYGDDGWIETFAKSIRPYVNAGCEIAFDAAAGWPMDGPEHSMIRTLARLGTPVHIEGPEIREPVGVDVVGHLRDLPLIMNNQQLRSNVMPKPDRWDRPELYPKITTLVDGGAAPAPADLAGVDRSVWVSEHAAEWAPPLVRKDLAAGYDCCLFLYPSILEMGMERLISG